MKICSVLETLFDGQRTICYCVSKIYAYEYLTQLVAQAPARHASGPLDPLLNARPRRGRDY